MHSGLTLIDNFFPQDSIDGAIKLLKLRRDLYNSIPSYLRAHGFSRLSNDKNDPNKNVFTCFIDYRRKIFLCYRKNDITANTTKSREAKQKLNNLLCEMQQYNPHYQVIYGYLIGAEIAHPPEII